MSTTVGTLEKNVEKVISTLSPEELAKYIKNEIISISTNQAAGMNEDARFAEVHRIYDQHVLTKDWPGYAKFWRATDTEDIRYWSEMYFKAALESLGKQDALIALLLFAEYRTWITEYVKPYKTKKDPVWQKRMEMDREHMKGFLARKREIAKMVKEILEADFWETWGIERPVIDFSESDELLKTFEDVETWIAKREIQTEPGHSVPRISPYSKRNSKGADTNKLSGVGSAE